MRLLMNPFYRENSVRKIHEVLDKFPRYSIEKKSNNLIRITVHPSDGTIIMNTFLLEVLLENPECCLHKFLNPDYL
jgi:hypothetical protein